MAHRSLVPSSHKAATQASLLGLTLAAFAPSAACHTTLDTPPPQSQDAEDPTCLGATALAAMDTRTPVPLQPMMAWHQKQNMMDHLRVIQEVVDGAAREDWTAVAEAASRVASSPQTAQMCTHMGAGAPGFTDMALAFHERADGIQAAALQHDGRAVLAATANTLDACTSCHARFRQDVVDARTWSERTETTLTPHQAH